jgi:glc operon protein GlcG
VARSYVPPKVTVTSKFHPRKPLLQPVPGGALARELEGLIPCSWKATGINVVPIRNRGAETLSCGKLGGHLIASRPMLKLLVVTLSLVMMMSAANLPSKKYLNLGTVKTMVAAAEAKAQELNVEVTICIVDESGNLLFLEKADGASLNTLQFAQKKARHAAFYRQPSKDGADALKKGNMDVLAFPDFFPNQGGLPILMDGQILGGIAASGAKSEIDEQIAQAGIDALLKK